MWERGSGVGEGVCEELGEFDVCLYSLGLILKGGGANVCVCVCVGSQVTYFKQRRVMEHNKKQTMEKLEKEGARVF